MRAYLTALFCLFPLPSVAQSFVHVTDESQFVELIRDKSLRRFGVTLHLTSDGQITGRAFGYDVTGVWRWENGYFCRVMSYGDGVLPDNCQMVLRRDETLRFIADRGQGDQADLRLR